MCSVPSRHRQIDHETSCAPSPRNAPVRLPPNYRAPTHPPLRCIAAIPARATRCTPRRLGSRARGRFWRFVSRARPFARIALSADCARDTSGLAARPPSPTRRFSRGRSPPLRFASARRTLRREPLPIIQRASPPGWFVPLRRRSGLGCLLSLRRSRDLLRAEPHPAGLPHDSTCAGGRPGGASAFVRPRLKVLLAALRSTLRDGADRRHPSGAADFTVRLGLGSA